jgi:nicotinate-nucleotide adenylyltransferase
VGHLWLAEAAREQLALDRVLFLPVGEPPHKEGKRVTAVTHRLAMTQLAVQDNPFFAVDTTDSDRPPPHTTVTLLPHIQAQYPKAQLWLLIGADSLRDLPLWVEPARIVQG